MDIQNEKDYVKDDLADCREWVRTATLHKLFLASKTTNVRPAIKAIIDAEIDRRSITPINKD